MMTQDRDYEDALRRALTAAAESIEPAGDGLQRIRHRLDSPRSVFSECAEWLELRRIRFLVRLEPVTEAGRTALRRTGPLAGLVSFVRGLLSPPAARRPGGRRGAAGSRSRLGPAGPWLKPVLAVSAAVAIVVVGVVILNHETGTLINPANGSYSTASPGSGLGNGGKTANSKRWKLPLGVYAHPEAQPARRGTRACTASCPQWPAPRRRRRARPPRHRPGSRRPPRPRPRPAARPARPRRPSRPRPGSQRPPRRRVRPPEARPPRPQRSW